MNKNTIEELKKYNLLDKVNELLNTKEKYVNITDSEIDNLFNNSKITMYYNGPVVINKDSFIKVSDELFTKALVIYKGLLKIEEMNYAVTVLKELNNDHKLCAAAVKGEEKEVLIITLK